MSKEQPTPLRFAASFVTNQQQRKHLKERIDTARSKAHGLRHAIYDKHNKEPAVIKRARERIAAFEKFRGAKIAAEVKAKGLDSETITETVKKAREALLFFTPEQALDAVQELEKRYAK